jgi:hypothetical protein
LTRSDDLNVWGLVATLKQVSVFRCDLKMIRWAAKEPENY